MENIYLRLPEVEQIPIKLRDTYERFGYTKYRMAKFEPYDLYREHKGFLKSEKILTFNDKKGRLLALKPDVTISIVNSIRPEDDECKFFYVENVYRAESGDYEENYQIGLEYIGGNALYAETEVVLLAYKSLSAISENFVLNLGHTGVWTACFDYLGLTDKVRAEFLGKIKNKNVHELIDLAKNAGVNEDGLNLLSFLASLSKNLDKGIDELKKYEKVLGIKEYLDELTTIENTISALGDLKKCNLDLSVINDLTYYNGVLFQGFIQELSHVLLAGGRYDNLMKSFGKDQRAVGFAIYTEELSRAFKKDTDVSPKLVTGANVVDVIKKVDEIANAGNTAKGKIEEGKKC